MRLLILTSHDGGVAELLPALDYLGHETSEAPLTTVDHPSLLSIDAVVVDATQQLGAAANACQLASVQKPARPILVVASEPMLVALKATWGFDDWVLATASPSELETRLRLLNRDTPSRDDAQQGTRIGDLVIDQDSYQVHLDGQPLDLTYKEFELLRTLAAHPGRVFTRELLLQEIWGYDYFGGSRTVDVHIRRLRAKLGPEHDALIGTVRGVGYRITPPTHDADGR